MDAIRNLLNMSASQAVTCNTVPANFIHRDLTNSVTTDNEGLQDYKVLGLFDAVRTQTPFARVYKFWELVGTSYEDRFSDARIGSFWANSMTLAKVNPPHIYNNADVADGFDAGPGDINDFQLSFWADVHDSQLPIRYYRVTLPHNYTAIDQYYPTDGRGVDDNYSSYGSTRTKKSGGVMFGPFGHIYDISRDPLTGRSDLKTCVEVADNWGACTRTCADLDTNGNLSTWITRADGTLSGSNGCTFP